MCETCLDNCHKLREPQVGHFLSLQVEEVYSRVDNAASLYFCWEATTETN